MLKHAKQFFDLGWGVLWIRPGSKAPVKAGWTTGPRDDWRTLEREYQEGYGLGVRLGEVSPVASGGFLANIDVDVKSADPRHRKEALQALEKAYPGFYAKAPTVKTGYGLRLFVRTAEPLDSGKLARSEETCVVFMPTTDISAAQLKAVKAGLITEQKLKLGYRVRPAWELELMSKGRQVVLPPSIHPETGKPYSWERPLGTAALPLLTGATKKDIQRETNNNTNSAGGIAQKFVPVNVDLVSSTLPDAIVNGILSGDGVDDRSAWLLKVALVMLKHGYTDDEIVSVLTDRTTYLGEAGYEHAQTNKREGAARWIRNYTLKKAKAKLDPAEIFSEPVDAGPPLEPGAAAEQAAELKGLSGWETRLKRRAPPKGGGEATPVPSVENTVLVLENAVAKDVFTRDLFRYTDAYGVDAPWSETPTKGKPVDDDDPALITLWIGRNYRFEPADHVLQKAITAIAVANGFHPIRDELEALPPWDGVGRIDTWLAKYFGAKGPRDYLAQIFRKWLVASVTRTYRPGAKFDWLPIFQGAQGTGKSSFGSILFGEDYFSDYLPPLDQKDAALSLQGIRCHEFGELDSLRKNELETTKAFITRTTDKVRPPYGKRWLETYRGCVFFGTTNRDAYLKDDSGNRRFMPVEVGRLNFEALKRDRVQLWAEALFIFKNDLEGSLYLDGEADEFAKAAQLEKLVEDDATFMAEAFERFVAIESAKPEADRFDFSRFKLTTLFDSVAGPFARWQQNGRNLLFAAKAIKSLGGVKHVSRGLGWWRYELPKK